jgi:hypothetical protein
MQRVQRRGEAAAALHRADERPARQRHMVAPSLALPLLVLLAASPRGAVEAAAEAPVCQSQPGLKIEEPRPPTRAALLFCDQVRPGGASTFASARAA